MIPRTKKYYLDRLGELKGEYSGDGVEAVDIDKTKYLYPHGRNLEEQQKASKGNRKDEYILNNTGFAAVRVATAGMWAGTTPATEKWMRLADEDKDLNESTIVAEFYQKSTDTILQDFDRSNFYTAMELMFRDLLTYSISCVIMDEDFENVFNFTHVPNGQFFVDVDYRGDVKAIYREFTKMARNVIDEYGEENVSHQVREMVADGKTGGQLVTLLQVIERNHARDIDKEDKLNMPWMSMTYEVNKEHLDKPLRQSGYRTQPFVAPRWNVSSGNKYGDGPGDMALGDVKELQYWTKKLKLAVAMELEPPTVSTDDEASIKTGPRQVTYTKSNSSGKPSVTPLYQVTTDISKTAAIIIDIQERIKTALFSDLFFALSGTDKRERTATEIIAIKTELLRLLGGAMQRIPGEALFPLVERAFDIEFNLGRLPDIPEEIKARPIKIEIISSLTKAQELNIVTPIEQMIGFVGSVSQMLPEVLDKVDIDQAVDELNRVFGIPAGIIRSDEVVEEIRGIRAEMALEEKQDIQAQQAIMGAKEMSQTDLSGDNALTATLGQ
jgi:hypothetical protein